MSMFEPLRPGPRSAGSGRMVHPRSWVRRHWIISVVVAVVLLAGLLAWLRPWPAPCGEGLALTQTGTTEACVGIDIASTALRPNDPLADLESTIAGRNAAITGDFATVVLLDDLTPDPNADSITVQSVRHEIEGAITAIDRANNTSVASGQIPKLKLMLANWGSGANGWLQAVDAIKKATPAQHVAAVAGITQSLAYTRSAAERLSPDIVTVSSMVTAEDMGIDKEGKALPGFYRVAPTNSEEARAAVNYIGRRYSSILVLSDNNPKDNYATTLRDAFLKQPGMENAFRESYESPDDTTQSSVNRAIYVTNQFAKMHSTFCASLPDLIYFAGRGTDLGFLLTALHDAGSCGLKKIDIMTGDSATKLVGQPLSGTEPAGRTDPSSQTVQVQVFYTGVAAPHQWDGYPSGPDNPANYQKFLEEFNKNRFQQHDLDDGYVMMSHDAVLTAAMAIRDDKDQATNVPSTVRSSFLQFNCNKSIPGASGAIVFQDSHVPANVPVNKAMPIMQIQPDGIPRQLALVWPDGHPLDPRHDTCGGPDVPDDPPGIPPGAQHR